jgi:hypothetical protein
MLLPRKIDFTRRPVLLLLFVLASIVCLFPPAAWPCSFKIQGTRKRPECFLSDFCRVDRFNCDIIYQDDCRVPGSSVDNKSTAAPGMERSPAWNRTILVGENNEPSQNNGLILIQLPALMTLVLILVLAAGVPRQQPVQKMELSKKKINKAFYLLALYWISFSANEMLTTLIPLGITSFRETPTTHITSHREPTTTHKFILNHFELDADERQRICTYEKSSILHPNWWPHNIKVKKKTQEQTALNYSTLKFLALYFPQWYPAPENDDMDDWRFFTNLTHNSMGHPLYGPMNGARYDSRCKNVRETQAALAKKISHRWFHLLLLLV